MTTKLLYNQTLVKACQIDYEDGPISPEYTLIHTRGWHLSNLFRNLKHKAMVCMSMGDNGLEWNQRYTIGRWFERPLFEFSDIPANIVKLYCTHCAVQHDRIEGFPAGVMFTEDGNNLRDLETVEALPIPKTKLLYVNFSNTHPSREQLKKLYPWATHTESKPTIDYFKEMKQHKFVLCPRGHGPDSYRVWESLYLGCIPIVPNKDLGGCHFHFKMPILETNWNFTPQMLEAMWKETNFKVNLDESYWIKKIQDEHLQLFS